MNDATTSVTSNLPWVLNRASFVPPSCCHAVFRAVEEKKRGTDELVLGLHVGEPYFRPPKESIAALIEAANKGQTAYTSAEGLYDLRAAITDKLKKKNGIQASTENILVCPGSTQGLAAAIQSVAEENSECLLPSIHWPIHLQQCILAGLRPTFFELNSDYTIDPYAVLAAATPRTRVLILNTPANPTGAVISSECCRHLVEISHQHNWKVISDEAYEDFVYEGSHTSPASFESDLPEIERKVFSVFSFSKSYAMTGYRLGYVVAPHPEAARLLRTVQEASIIAPSTPIQFAGLAALKNDQNSSQYFDLLNCARHQCLSPFLSRGLMKRLPTGGWYALLDICSSGLNADDFASALLEEKGVAVTSARGFSLRPQYNGVHELLSFTSHSATLHLIRVAFCVDPVLLKEGVARLIQFFEERKGTARN